MGEVLRDELTELLRLAKSIDELIIKLYAVLGEVVFEFEKLFVRSVHPVVAFVSDYIGRRKEAFAVSYYSGNNIRVIHESGVRFYAPFNVDPGAISLQELCERLFSDPAVKDVVLKTAVKELAALLQDSLRDAREKINLESPISDLKCIIEETRDPVILDEAKLLLAEAVVLKDALSRIREEMDSLIEELERIDAVNQLEDVKRSLDCIVNELGNEKHLVDRVKPVVKKARILAQFTEKFADVIEEIKREARRQCTEEESEDEY